MAYYQGDPMMGFPSFLRGGAPPVGMSTRRFDEYYRCYPVVMMSGPDRSHVNHGGKVFLPPSALDKLTRLHISYPMLFELINGNAGKTTHAGVLEFIAEEGRIYLPQWLMNTLDLDPGDLLQIRSTDLPPGKFIKLQPQSPAFLNISDPRAVLENAFRNFSCLTKNDVFTFEYNDETFDVAVLEVKPDTDSHAIVTMETDLEVDFATPVGYVPPERTSGASTPRSTLGKPHGGPVHFQGTMAQSINYPSIAPSSNSAEAGARAVSSHFLSGGHKLSSKKSSKVPTPSPSTPVAGTSTNEAKPVTKRTNGPQPLRLPPGKLFFGYEVIPLRKKDENEEPVTGDEVKPRFQGQGQTLRAKKRAAGTDSGTGSGVNSDAEGKAKGKAPSRK
ncbi:ubiquitin fusion degradation protein UFD1-domain-containing protein [Exophiala viscosa]|uniref:Ubiquitin fusion degradation protein 1 n=1 Tax=Exophiala viscosa TaxID=2486360 RepID=A0AAN6DY77_9EURO|nr:ubiquitin fusion degradation protein UFD1-domain-containing protein [Exophiala viscosa]KAI1624275.1 ubiquitin fusion degradation protein UFD1-domain-containing protein [Exophiala viscosa]